MRILLTTESALPYVSGVTVSVDALARGLGAAGHEVLVLGPRPADGRDPGPVASPGPPPAYAWLPSFELPRIAPAGYRLPIPVPWADATRRAMRFRPDVVHAHSPFSTGLLARRIARRANAPLVFTHHTRFADYRHYLGPLAAPGAGVTTAYLERWWRGCAAIVAPSSDLGAEIAGRLPSPLRRRVHVIPTGVDVAGIRRLAPVDARPLAGWPADATVVATLGRLAPEKSPDVILEAAALAIGASPSVRLLVIGGGPAEDACRQRAARPDLAGRALLTGALPRPDALARLAGADLFVFASRTETQGLVLAEAITAGLPAVAVDGPGVRDSVRDGVDGVIVAAEPAATRPARLAAAIGQLARDPARRAAMSARAVADADRFGLDRRLTETLALYAAVRAEGRLRPPSG